MFKGFLIVLFVLLFRICHAQLAERWTLSELDIKLNAPKSLFWDHQSGRLLLLANDSSGIPQVNSINQLYSNVEQLTRDTLFKISVSCFQPTGTLMVSGITRENYEIIKYHPGNKQAVPLINRNLQKKEAHANTSGTMVAFAGKEENDRHWNLYTYDFTYNNLNKLGKDEFNCSYPRWSPKAEYICYQSKLPNETFTRLKVIHWYGKLHFEIIEDEHHVLHPAWSPNSQWLAYVRENHKGSELMICRKNGTDKTLIYKTPHKISYPAWSPTGDSIAFLLHTDGNRANICLLVQE
jgi:hypothetical protein